MAVTRLCLLDHLCGGYTPLSPRSSFSPSTSVSGHNAMVPAVSADSGQADREQLVPTFAKFAEVLFVNRFEFMIQGGREEQAFVLPSE